MNNYVKTYRGDGGRKKLPLFAKILYCLTALTFILHIISVFSEKFSDFFNRHISSVIRFLFANITDIIPFSLAEALILLSPVFVFLLIRYAVKNHCDSWRAVFTYMGSVLSIACLFYILFFWSFGVGYNTSTLDKRLDLERKAVSAEELYETALILADEVDAAAAEVTFRNMDFSIMPYGIDTLSEKLNSAYAKFSNENDFVSKLNSSLKPVMLSEAMSYTHITGVYTYFTGEANINVSFPDYTIPFTAAHELAHQRGIAREDEANFVAFLVCKQSDDPYIRYCAYMNMLDYILNALYSADPELYADILKILNDNVVYEMIAYSDFFEKYSDSVAGTLSGAVNDTYLKLNGTEGEKSYGMVVDLAVAYYNDK